MEKELKLSGIKDHKNQDIKEGSFVITIQGTIFVVELSDKFGWCLIQYNKGSHEELQGDWFSLKERMGSNLEVIGSIFDLSEVGKSLTRLAKQYRTDKLEHNYIPFYSKHMPSNFKSILEIGCFQGASLKMWKEYCPSAEIHTIDLFLNEQNATEQEIKNQGFVTYKGNQTDIGLLSSIRNIFDIIIDDGSHNSEDQQVSFKHLFLNNLSPGGLYVIEDLHCCKYPFYWGTEIDKFDDTALSVLNKFNDTGNLDNKYFTEEENEIFKSHILTIDIYMDKIAFITKK